LLKWWAGSSDYDIDEPRAIDAGIIEMVPEIERIDVVADQQLARLREVGMRGHMDMAVIAAVGYAWGK